MKAKVMKIRKRYEIKLARTKRNWNKTWIKWTKDNRNQNSACLKRKSKKVDSERKWKSAKKGQERKPKRKSG